MGIVYGLFTQTPAAAATLLSRKRNATRSARTVWREISGVKLKKTPTAKPAASAFSSVSPESASWSLSRIFPPPGTFPPLPADRPRAFPRRRPRGGDRPAPAPPRPPGGPRARPPPPAEPPFVPRHFELQMLSAGPE